MGGRHWMRSLARQDLAMRIGCARASCECSGSLLKRYDPNCGRQPILAADWVSISIFSVNHFIELSLDSAHPLKASDSCRRSSVQSLTPWESLVNTPDSYINQ